MIDINPKLPSHGEFLPTLEIIGWEEKRTIFWNEEKKELVPGGTGVILLHMRFLNGLPFTVTVGDYDFREFVLPKIEEAEDRNKKPSLPAPVA
jgi:hypothetical protein